MKENQTDRGSITLETAIALPIFIFLMLFIFGLLSLVRAENKMTHVFVQASKSLALDAYALEAVDTSDVFSVSLPSTVSDVIKTIWVKHADQKFTSEKKWYEGEVDTSVIKTRFTSYMANGNKADAEDILKSIGIENGLSGITFEATADGDDVTITMKYNLKFWLDGFGTKSIPIKKSVTVRLWK